MFTLIGNLSRRRQSAGGLAITAVIADLVVPADGGEALQMIVIDVEDRNVLRTSAYVAHDCLQMQSPHSCGIWTA